MNEYLQELYGADVDVDTQLAAAGEVLEKIAAEEGIDLSEVPEEEIGEMLMKISGLEGEDEDEGGYLEDEITVADVAAELSKVAAVEGVDLGELSREEQHDAFNWMAEQMSDPGYFEMNEKVAEADMLGRVMAQAFDDELEKQAGMGEYAAKAGRAIRHGAFRTVDALGGLGTSAVRSGKSRAAAGNAGVRKEIKRISREYGPGKFRDRLVGQLKNEAAGGVKNEIRMARRRIGLRRAMGIGAAAGGAGLAGAGYAAGRRNRK